MLNKIDNENLLYILYNLIIMMEDRGYSYLSTNYEKILNEKKMIVIKDKNLISDYTYLLKNNYCLFFKKNDNYVICLFAEAFSDYDLNITYICKKIISFLSNHKLWCYINKSIIICPDDVDNKINRKIKEEIYIIETIPYSRLLYNPTKHIDAVKHEKIKFFEQKHKKYSLKLPIILKSDPISKWYDYNINDIIKIIRSDNEIFHRIVKIENEY